MSDSNVTTSDELTKLKLTDLRKLCKKHELLTTGTKLELISRLIENQGETFTILQPGDEAKLLGDDVDEESTSFSLTDTVALDTLDKTEVDDDLINVRTSADTESSTRPIGSKRTVSVLSPAAACPVPAKCAVVESALSKPDSPPTTAIVSATPTSASTDLSEAECLNTRAARFGLQRPPGAGAALTDDKLAARARRFGLPVSENRSNTTGIIRAPSTTDSIDAELLRKRAERFGEVTSPLMDKLTAEERRASRLARFGPVSTGLSQTATVSSVSGSSSEEERKAARALKFGIVSDEDKLLQRKARFGLA